MVPVVHGEGQHVGCSNFSSIPGGRGSSIHLTGTTVSAGVPEEMPHTTQKKSILILLLNVCQVLGLSTYYPQAAFNRGFMNPLGERTPSPVTGRGERDSSHHLDSKHWVVVLLQLATGGHRVLPASHDKRPGPFLLLTGHLIRDYRMMPLQGQN